ncbi:phosphoribosyltransferase family protein [Streptomyces sp. ITFR-6]|uniref:phosphoribosyltransferase family protein n=1 Tax=Streptomyces sp. ITFR-6 TaxID=3075197 RepID=UPI00288AD9AA|nr:phosphoribosyltransferase family protein [Streptomyces sp. ITFR-6]WNI27600.1 phosphoribosyltransferase family protein [Streptomyces sp. ITFR-6]
MLFSDRADAGQRLAAALRSLAASDPVVLGLPRGGVPVAFRVAQELGAPLDVIVVRKLGVPRHPELGFGALGEGGVRVISEDILRRSGASAEELAAVERAESAELLRRARAFRGDRPRIRFEGRVVIIVDDGVATGATALAACEVARAQGAARVVLAVPVAAPDAAERVRGRADELVCLSTPLRFAAVGEWYRNFGRTPDEEVVALLARAGGRAAAPAPVEVEAGGVVLPGELTAAGSARALVVFAHGSGSSRHSPRNRSVAAALHRAGFGTLLFDLLTPAEEADRANVFDIGTLAERLVDATARLLRRESLPVGVFGASTGAAASLQAAAAMGAERGTGIGAVVSRGGRPDLAGPCLGDVRSPTLLVVGGRDTRVLELNQQAKSALRCENRLDVVAGSTHLFEEPGALDEVAGLAREWFTEHLTDRSG